MVNPKWTNRGKTVAQLIEELSTFENKNMEVRISIDDGETSLPISLLSKSQGKYALLKNCEDIPTVLHHHNEKK